MRLQFERGCGKSKSDVSVMVKLKAMPRWIPRISRHMMTTRFVVQLCFVVDMATTIKMYVRRIQLMVRTQPGFNEFVMCPPDHPDISEDTVRTRGLCEMS